MTSNHWDRSNQIYTENDTTLLVQSAGSGVKLGDSVVLLRDPGNWQMLPDGSGYYLVMTNGTRITIKDPYSVPDNQRTATINGATYMIGMPNQYYQATYQGNSLLIPFNGQDWDNYVQSYFYTDLGIDGGTKYELPYPGAMATSWWDLQGIESQGQKLRTLKTISIEDSDYLINFDTNSQTYYINIGGSRQSVTLSNSRLQHILLHNKWPRFLECNPERLDSELWKLLPTIRSINSCRQFGDNHWIRFDAEILDCKPLWLRL